MDAMLQTAEILFCFSLVIEQKYWTRLMSKNILEKNVDSLTLR